MKNYTTFITENQEIEPKLDFKTETKIIHIEKEKEKIFLNTIKKAIKICIFAKIPEPTYKIIKVREYYILSKDGNFDFSSITDDLKVIANKLSEAKKTNPNSKINVNAKKVNIYEINIVTDISIENKWIILGIIDHISGIIKAAPNQKIPLDLIPSNLEDSSYCDHCHTKRGRNKTIFIKKISTGEILRVGGSCIKYYLGYNYDKVLEFLNIIDFVDRVQQEREQYDWNSSIRIESIIPTDEIIKYFTWYVEKYGYLSSAAADKINIGKEDVDKVLSTKHKISNILHNIYNIGYHEENNTTISEFYSIIDKIPQEKVDNFLKFVDENKVENWIYNAYNFCKEGTVKESLINYILGALSFYFGKLKYEESKNKKADGISNFVGVIGEKEKLENLEIVNISGFETEYGWSNVYKLKDVNGNVFTKFGTINPKFLIDGGDEIKIGSKVSFLAEIRKHDVYNGNNQTVLGKIARI